MLETIVQSLEESLVDCISQIPEVESIYKYDDGAYTVFFIVLSTMTYQREVHMKVYEQEYLLFQEFPDADAMLRCVPRLGMSDDEFLPTGSVRIYLKMSENV